MILEGGAIVALENMGFMTESGATSVLKDVRHSIPVTRETDDKPHIVLAVMESMGRDVFEAHDAETNDTPGTLSGELGSAVVFPKGISVENGTFNSLEGILFDTPLTPITQSRYGKQPFGFSKILPFREAGYKTVFLTAGPEAWRQIDANFPLQGFDRIIGATSIRKCFPQAETGTWGVGDDWMFKTAYDLLSEADRTGERLFIVMLSATNHPPHHVPDGVAVNPVSVRALPDFITDDHEEPLESALQTYQYASDSLGRFIHRVRTGNAGRETMIAVTGDHNMRLHYCPEGYWHHQYGVPLLFWLPESMQAMKTKADTGRWVGHRDIFPTIAGVVLGTTPKEYEGRNLFAEDGFDMANAWSGISRAGFAIGDWGAVAVDKRATCFEWEEDRLVPVSSCTGIRKKMGDAARAQRALADYTVRKKLLNER